MEKNIIIIIKHIIIIIIILLIIIIYFNNKTYFDKDESYFNFEKHKTDEFYFAHFSKIDNNNYLLYPSLMFTNSREFVVNQGESLWIPSKWWHWIRSEKSIAINYWMFTEPNYNHKSYPHIIKDKLNYDLLYEILKYKDILSVWNSKDNKLKDEKYDINVINNDKAIITLPGYTTDNKYSLDKNNQNLYNKVSNLIKIPDYIDKNNVDKNIWITLGYHDTGLHYDDYNGLLTVLEGKKYITLYPPSDSIYLYPFDILPFWTKNKPIKMSYNTFTHISDIQNQNALPSSRLLYESIKIYNNKNILIYLSNTLNKINKQNSIVWGCKLTNGIIRWEIYVYLLNNNINLPIVSNNNDQYKIVSKIMSENKNLTVYSYDLYNKKDFLGKDIHFYYLNNKDNIKLPYIGYSNQVNQDTTVSFESDWIIDKTDTFINNYEEYCNIIKFKDVKNCKILLTNYKCNYICIHRKNDEQIYIQYFDISISDFILFLKKFNYLSKLIEHVETNKSNYNDICHEITIVYDIKTLSPIRSAFYGIL